LKIRHILLALLAVLAIAFMQPLVTFLGGLTLLLGVGTLIFRDLTPVGQDAVERRVLGWLRRARSGSAAAAGSPPTSPHRFPAVPVASDMPVERPRRSRTRTAAPADSTGGGDAAPPIP
jgi:hypothetical protein